MSQMSFESYSLCQLIYRLGNPPKTQAEVPIAVPPVKIFSSWVQHLHHPVALGTGKRLFRLLYPHEGARRRYGLKETLLARELGKILGVQGLDRWDCVAYNDDSERGGEGCLGLAVLRVMEQRVNVDACSTMNIRELDAILDELASLSSFSALSLPPNSPRDTSQILTHLYRDAGFSPYAMAVLTQIILRDLRPLLSPLPRLPVRNPTTMLRLTSTSGPAQLELIAALRTWDSRAADLYVGGKGDIDWCCDAVDNDSPGPSGQAQAHDTHGPVVGVNVQIPKCRKGRSVEDALSEFTGSKYAPPARVVWAETKYDGYRLQIHVEIRQTKPKITIFSKSKRNSTADRLNAHAIIASSLGLSIEDNMPLHVLLAQRRASAPQPERSVGHSIILEAEVVPFNEGQREGGRGPGVEEFWWLGEAGVSAQGPGRTVGATQRTNSDRHLQLIFFDILHLDGTSLLYHTYTQRRNLLESVVRPIHGFAAIAERTPIYLHLGCQPAIAALRQALARSNAEREEGLVLKSSCSPYPGIGRGHRWVKLKKDYIPELGDCVDLVILGAGWDADRARELRVDTSVITTFYVGVLVNAPQVRARAEAPHFEIMSRVSYGSSRDELEVYNANIRLGRWGSRPFDRDDPLKRRLLGLSWTYHLPRTMTPPSILFNQPMCCEVMGAGFQKLPWSHLYEVRWPRLQKIYDTRERPWNHALTGPELLKTAHQALGYVDVPPPIGSPENDSIRALWRNASSHAIDIVDSPSLPSPTKRAIGLRVASAPDLMEILKMSPPTPRSSGRMFRTARSPTTPMTNRRLQQALALDLSGEQGDTGDDAADEAMDDSIVVLRTPGSSPVKRLLSPGVPMSLPGRKRPRMSLGEERHPVGSPSSSTPSVCSPIRTVQCPSLRGVCQLAAPIQLAQASTKDTGTYRQKASGGQAMKADNTHNGVEASKIRSAGNDAKDDGISLTQEAQERVKRCRADRPRLRPMSLVGRIQLVLRGGRPL